MNENVKSEKTAQRTPVLIPMDLQDFWFQVRLIIREELLNLKVEHAPPPSPGFNQIPLLKMEEIQAMFRVSKQTIHDWCKTGQLRKIKMRSRVYFLMDEVQQSIHQKGSKQ